MNIRVDVTHEDINRGKQKDCYSCPISLAMNRAEGVSNAAVGMTLLFDYGGERKENTLRYSLMEFAADFDYGAEVKPFSFDLRL